MDQKQEIRLKDILLMFSPWVLACITGMCVYMFTQLQATREQHLQYQKYVAENYVTKADLHRDIAEIKLTLRDIRDELKKP